MRVKKKARFGVAYDQARAEERDDVIAGTEQRDGTAMLEWFACRADALTTDFPGQCRHTHVQHHTATPCRKYQSPAHDRDRFD